MAISGIGKKQTIEATTSESAGSVESSTPATGGASRPAPELGHELGKGAKGSASPLAVGLAVPAAKAGKVSSRSDEPAELYTRWYGQGRSGVAVGRGARLFADVDLSAYLWDHRAYSFGGGNEFKFGTLDAEGRASLSYRLGPTSEAAVHLGWHNPDALLSYGEQNNFHNRDMIKNVGTHPGAAYEAYLTLRKGHFEGWAGQRNEPTLSALPQRPLSDYRHAPWALSLLSQQHEPGFGVRYVDWDARERPVLDLNLAIINGNSHEGSTAYVTSEPLPFSDNSYPGYLFVGRADVSGLVLKEKSADRLGHLYVEGKARYADSGSNPGAKFAHHDFMAGVGYRLERERFALELRYVEGMHGRGRTGSDGTTDRTGWTRSRSFEGALTGRKLIGNADVSLYGFQGSLTLTNPEDENAHKGLWVPNSAGLVGYGGGVRAEVPLGDELLGRPELYLGLGVSRTKLDNDAAWGYRLDRNSVNHVDHGAQAGIRFRF